MHLSARATLKVPDRTSSKLPKMMIVAIGGTMIEVAKSMGTTKAEAIRRTQEIVIPPSANMDQVLVVTMTIIATTIRTTTKETEAGVEVH